MDYTPKALTIAGSDSGGCAGIQADIKTFSALGVFGMSAITSVTSQNTLGVSYVEKLSPLSVSTQIDAVMDDIGADAVKIGMLFSKDIVEAVVASLEKWEVDNLVLDTVMVSTTGAVLLHEDAVEAIKARLFPMARLITPNLPEAEVLAGMKITNRKEQEEACRRMVMRGARSVLLKGGHGLAEKTKDATDIWFDGKSFYDFPADWIDSKNTHGTGCTYSAAIAAYLARKFTLESAIRHAKMYIAKAIEQGRELSIGTGSGPVQHFIK
jgi:hydroxymethylpyrimidine/phosphomethylpyrimidine kinase